VIMRDIARSFWVGLGDRVIIVGYSQSGRIATIAKRDFIENYDPADPDATPNGGILQRYKFFGTIRRSSDAKTVSAQADTTPTSVPEPKEPNRPKVRGPIEFDAQKTPTESPSAPSGEPSATSETSATETNSKTASDSTNSPGSENKDAA
jgi:hypothetical protein